MSLHVYLFLFSKQKHNSLVALDWIAGACRVCQTDTYSYMWYFSILIKIVKLNIANVFAPWNRALANFDFYISELSVLITLNLDVHLLASSSDDTADYLIRFWFTYFHMYSWKLHVQIKGTIWCLVLIISQILRLLFFINLSDCTVDTAIYVIP